MIEFGKIDSTGSFWLALWAIFASVVISVSYLTASYYIDTNARIAKAIEAGRNPLEAKCAFDYTFQLCQDSASLGAISALNSKIDRALKRDRPIRFR